MGRLEAELANRCNRRGAQQGVAQLEQRIGAAGVAGVQLGPERVEPRQGEVGSNMAAEPDSRDRPLAT